MNGFYNEMLMRMGLPADQTVGVKITVCDLCGVLVEGHKGLLGCSAEEISLRVKKKKLVIRGKNLLLLEITPDEAYIKGKIFAFEVEGDD